MAEHPNGAMARSVIEAYIAGDPDSATAMLADDVVWHYIGSDEPLRGKAEVAERGPACFAAEVTAKLHDVLANDDHVVVMLKVHAERQGRTLDYDIVEVYHVQDGKIVERWALSQDTAPIAAFFA